jgi:hypothetical protein
LAATAASPPQKLDLGEIERLLGMAAMADGPGRAFDSQGSAPTFHRFRLRQLDYGWFSRKYGVCLPRPHCRKADHRRLGIGREFTPGRQRFTVFSHLLCEVNVRHAQRGVAVVPPLDRLKSANKTPTAATDGQLRRAPQ